MGKWKKGESGNPRGRPRTPPDLKEACRELSADAIAVLGKIVRSKRSRDQDKIRAAEALLDRGYGRPAQAVELSGPGGGPLESTTTVKAEASDEQLADILARMARAGALPGTSGPGEAAPGADATDDAVHAAAADDAAVGVPAAPAA